jgi:hypothetical protein
MRKLTEMMGYNIKYIRSAMVDVRISYNSIGKEAMTELVKIDKFTNLKDVDGLINYITLEDIYLNAEKTAATVPCIQGSLIECETDEDNVVSMLHLDDNKRYYFPETQVAENGVFVTNITDGSEGEP